MSDFRTLSADYSVAPQISFEDVVEAKATGFAMIVNNRPDGEEPDAPQGDDIAGAAAAEGLAYAAIPIGHAGFSHAQIDALDNQWKAEREAADKPLIAATLSSPLSVYLARIQGKSLGLYAEIFVMDQNGLNVGQSSVTSDFWQGDEDKFQKTFDVADDAMFVDAAEWDDEAKIWRNQVSFTLLDASKKKIGAVTMEINLTELERRLLAAS